MDDEDYVVVRFIDSVWIVDTSPVDWDALEDSVRRWQKLPTINGGSELANTQTVGAMATLHIRPFRIAYCIRHGSESQFMAAVQIASSRWGGQTEPIVQIDETGIMDGDDLEALRRCRPLAVRNLSGIPREIAAATFQRLGIEEATQDSLDYRMYGAGIAAVIDETVDVSEWPIPYELSVVAAAAVGTQERADPTDLPPGALPPVMCDLASCVIAEIRRQTVLNATIRSIDDPAGYVEPNPAVLWVARDRNSLADALAFWNLRALLPLSPEPPFAVLTDRAALHDQSVAQQLNHALGRQWRSTPDLFMYSVTLTADELADARDELGLEPFSDGEPDFRMARTLSVPLEGRSLAASTNINPRQVLYPQPRLFGTRSTALAVVEPTGVSMLFPGPISFAQWGHVVLARITGLQQFQVPDRPSVAMLFLNAGRWADRGQLEMCTTAIREYAFGLTLPDQDLILKAALRDRNVSFSPSPNGGALASGLIDRINDPIVFRRPGMIPTIKALTTERTTHIVSALKRAKVFTISEETVEDVLAALNLRFKRASRSLREIAEPNGLEPEVVAGNLGALIRTGLAARGALLQCEMCRTATFVHEHDLVNSPRCPACGTSTEYAQSTSGEPEFHYRLDGLVDFASDQGVHRHMAVYQTLIAQWPGSYLVMGAKTSANGEDIGELDILGYHENRILGGEIKPTAAEFTEEQLTEDVEKSSKASADLHIMACFEPLPERTIDTAAGLAQERNLGLHILDTSTIIATQL